MNQGLMMEEYTLHGKKFPFVFCFLNDMAGGHCVPFPPVMFLVAAIP
jgi:hypothetical protein